MRPKYESKVAFPKTEVLGKPLRAKKFHMFILMRFPPPCKVDTQRIIL
jgi:hypothetical protein